MDWNKGELREVKFPLNEFFQTVCGKPHKKIYEYTLAEKPLLPSVMPIREQRLICFPKTVCVFITRVGEKIDAVDCPEQTPKFIPVNVEKSIWTLFP